MSLVTSGAIVVGGGAVFSQLIGSLITRLTERVSTDLLAGGIGAIIAIGVELLEPIWLGTWYLLSLWVAFELRAELVGLARLLLQLVVHLCEVLRWWWEARYFHRRRSIDQGPVDIGGSDLSLLTCHQMVFEGFLLSERSGEWDEVWGAGTVPDTTTLICRSTTEDGSDWIWSLLKCEVTSLKPPVGAGAARGPPAGVAADTVNWICSPSQVQQRWNPSAAEITTLKQEAALLGLHLKSVGMQDSQITIPGRGMTLIPLVVQQAGNVALAPAPRGDAGGLGPGPVAGGDRDPFNMQSLTDVIQELKDMAKKKKDEPQKKKKRSKKKKKSDKKKKKRKGSSTSTSRSSRSRSSRSSSSASSSGSSGPLQWKSKGKDRRVRYEEVHAVDKEKFKRKGELIAYATKHPGALTAHFLASIFARLSKGRVERSAQLREASVVAWAAQHSGLSEVRDVREVLTLAEAMDSINRKEIERAMDILSQRILAIQQAKKKGGSWDKAEAIELIPGGTSLASSSMLALTN